MNKPPALAPYLVLLLAACGGPRPGPDDLAAPATSAAAPAVLANEVAPAGPDPTSAQCPARPLSAVGAAMAAVPGVGARRTSCALMPPQWLYTIDGLTDTPGDYANAVRSEFLQTRYHFSHSSLLEQPLYDFDALLVELHDELGTIWGGEVPDEKKPVLRFMYGMTTGLPDMPSSEDAKALWKNLTGSLAAHAGPPEFWNVKVAVRQAFVNYEHGWNHTKLNLRDGIVADASSLETGQLELAIRLGGAPAAEATRWYDDVWQTAEWARPDLCVESVAGLCAAGAPPATAPVTQGYAGRSVNVFPLRRGVQAGFIVPNFSYEADDALFAGMDASQRSIFFLNPSLTAEWPYSSARSVPLIDKIAERLGDGVDVKFVWGDNGAQKVTHETWEEIQEQLEDRFVGQGLSTRRREIAQCMFHVARHGKLPTLPAQGSHAKFYMLDGGGFYVGSQNMYPTGIRSTLWIVPELDEFGFYVDARPGVNADLTAEAIERVVEPTWDNARSGGVAPAGQNAPNHVVAHTWASCGAVRRPAHLFAQADPPSGYTCESDFDLWLDFDHVRHDEVARVVGETECFVSEQIFNVSVEGAVGTDGQFRGTIAGGVSGAGSHTAALTGTFVRGALDLFFADFEPTEEIAYRGTVTTEE